MDTQKQVKFSKFTGMVKIIADKTGYNDKFVGRVLNGKVNGDTPAGRKIKALALELAQRVASVTVEDEK